MTQAELEVLFVNSKFQNLVDRQQKQQKRRYNHNNNNSTRTSRQYIIF